MVTVPNVECDFVNYETDAGYASQLTSLMAVLTSVLVVNWKYLQGKFN